MCLGVQLSIPMGAKEGQQLVQTCRQLAGGVVCRLMWTGRLAKPSFVAAIQPAYTRLLRAWSATAGTDCSHRHLSACTFDVIPTRMASSTHCLACRGVYQEFSQQDQMLVCSVQWVVGFVNAAAWVWAVC